MRTRLGGMALPFAARATLAGGAVLPAGAQEPTVTGTWSGSLTADSGWPGQHRGAWRAAGTVGLAAFGSDISLAKGRTPFGRVHADLSSGLPGAC